MNEDAASIEVTNKIGREQLETLFFQLQRERIALTRAIMQLRGESPLRRARLVMRILVALLRLQRANRRTLAALGPATPSDGRIARPSLIAASEEEPAPAARGAPARRAGPGEISF